MEIGIIGAGISGLYAAYLLRQQNHNVKIYEANSHCGGRILSHIVDGERVAELGAELVYAPDAPLVKLLKELNISMYPFQGTSYYYYQEKLYPDNAKQLPEGLESLLEALGEIEDYRGDEIPLNQYFEQQTNYTSNWKLLIESFACEYGGNAENMGALNLALEESAWLGGNDEFYIRHPMQLVIDHFSKKLINSIQLNTQIKHINYRNDTIALSDNEGKEYFCDKLIVSVNLGILKAGDIHFNPALPDRKLSAIHNIGIDLGIKVILQFKEQWWPENLTTFEGGKHCMEYLASQYSGKPLLTAFLMGQQARAAENMDEKELGQMLTQELDQICNHQKASQTLCAVYFKDWGRDPNHKGAYSYPTPKSKGMREILSEPVDDKIFFMGEACNFNGHAATIHGAMETAKSAVENILQ